MRALISNRDYEQISALIDGQLSAREKSQLEEKIKKRPDLQAVLHDLEETKKLLRLVPRRKAPRNFTLTPAMVADIEANRKRSSWINLFPTLSFTSALATLALIASILFQLFPGKQSILPVDMLAKEPSFTAQQEMRSQEPEKESKGQESETFIAATQLAQSPDATGGEGFLEAPAAKMQDESSAGSSTEQPPIITWNFPYGGTEAYGMGGGSVPLEGAKGMGGDGYGVEAIAPNLSEPLPNGNIVVPLEAVNSIDQPQPSAGSQPLIPTQVEQSSKNVSPILGIPPAEEEGQITGQFAWGTSEDTTLVPLHEPSSDQLTKETEQTQPPASLLTVQLLLGLIAVLSGIGAFLSQRGK